ncbi:MAG: polysaccharide biosynthesis tyrosine autokinase [Fibrobacter sp.]|nr:polysaccharide biosynthesis tyrosine autokinase [Fibrobacter sp.]
MADNEQQNNVSGGGQPSANNSITLLDALFILWKRRYFLLLFILAGVVVGLAIGQWIRPQFTSDAMLQIDPKGNKAANRAMGEMGAILDVASPADAEIELIKSRLVLSFVVAEEHLEYSATPVSALNRMLHREGRMDIGYLFIPKEARSEKWYAVVTGENTYAVYSEDESKLVEGNVGDLLKAPYEGDTLQIRVDRIRKASVGEKFRISQLNPLLAVRKLAKSLKVAEKGKQTGVIGVSYSHRYADRAASILNTIANTYVRQNVEMRSADAAKTLEFLESQLPAIKAKLDSSEKILSDYRHHIGSVDMTGETRAHLDKEMDLQRQLLQLEQQRQQVTRLFKEEHPSVQTIVKQQNRLRGELGRLRKNAESMPTTQQELIRLQENVAVNNSQYTTMLNNIQQLRVVRAGEVGNVRVVDFAQIEPKPSKPKKMNILICSIAASFMIGVLIVFLRRMMRNGVRSSQELEHATDVSVYAKIPESKNRILNDKRHKQTLVESSPNDQACEAFRTLQTALDFSLSEEHNVVMVCGLVPGVGKSFVSKNLAAVYAMNGKRVLLIDADMRKGVIRSSKHAGLTEILSGKVSWREAVTDTRLENLFVLGCGKRLMSPSELLRHDRFKNILAEMKAEYDMILVDTPPVSLVTDAELIYPLVDFALMVVHYGTDSVSQIKESISNLRRYADKPCAFVMNHCEYEPGHYGYGYGYYGGGYYGKGYYSKK